MANANASIAASVILSNNPQIDGRAWITEQHTDNIAALHQVIYLWNPESDPALATLLATHATNLAASLQASEIATNISDIETLGSLATYTLNYSKAAENFAALRAAYAVATDRQVVMIGDFLNTLTFAQLQAAFGLSAAQVTTLQTDKLAPDATLAVSIRSAIGQ